MVGLPQLYRVYGWFTGLTICCIYVPFKTGLTVPFKVYGWFTMICCIDVPFKSGLTVYMVGLPRFVV